MSLKYIQRVEANLEDKLLVKDRYLDDVKREVNSLKNENEMLLSEVDKSTRFQQQRLGDTTRRVEEMKLKFGDFVTRRELRAFEDRLNAAMQDKITEDMKLILQKIADMGKVRIEDKRLNNDKFTELSKKLANLEHQQDNKIMKCQSHTDTKTKELDNDTKKSIKSIRDEINKLKDDINLKFEDNKVEVFNAITQKNTLQFNEYEQVLENFRQAIKDNSDSIQQQEMQGKKNQKHVDSSLGELNKRNTTIVKQIKVLKANQEEIMKKLEMDLNNKIEELEKTNKLKKKRSEEAMAKKIQEITDDIADLRSGMNVLNKSQRKDDEMVKEYVVKKIDSNEDGRIAEIQQELDDFNEKLNSLLKLEERFEKRISTMEESIEKNCRERHNALQSDCNRTHEDLNTKYSVLESSISSINKTVNKLEKTTNKNTQGISLNSKNVKDLSNAHNSLVKRVEILEKRLNGLIIELRKKLGDCSKEFQTHRNILMELIDREELVYELAIKEPEPKEEVIIEEVKSKQVNNVLVGTDNFKRSIELQVDIESPKESVEKKEVEVLKPIYEQDYRKEEPRESSRVLDETPKVQTEEMSEEEIEPNLDQLKLKVPRQISLEEKKESPIQREVTLDLTIPKRSPTVYDEISQQTDRNYMSEIVKERTLRAPNISKDLFSSSPHYLREDPPQSIDKRRITSTIDAVPQDNISSKNFRKSNKFTINLDEIPNIGQEDYHRATYSEFIDYTSMNFDNYEPEVDNEAGLNSKHGNQYKSDGSSNKKVRGFRTGYIEREHDLPEIDEDQVHESVKLTSQQDISPPKIIEPEKKPEQVSYEIAEENLMEEIKELVIPSNRESTS